MVSYSCLLGFCWTPGDLCDDLGSIWGQRGHMESFYGVKGHEESSNRVGMHLYHKWVKVVKYSETNLILWNLILRVLFYSKLPKSQIPLPHTSSVTVIVHRTESENRKMTLVDDRDRKSSFGFGGRRSMKRYERGNHLCKIEKRKKHFSSSENSV